MYGLASWREQHGLSGGESDRNAELLDELYQVTGAIVLGRRLFENSEAHWGDNPPFHCPMFILTHDDRARIVKDGGTTYNFVTDGIDSALQQARAAAGDRAVAVAGGANTIQQFIKAGLLDELQIHLVPVLLGDGIRLFDHIGTEQIELASTRVVESTDVTHLRFRVIK